MKAKATVPTCVNVRNLPASWLRPRVSNGLYMLLEANEITSLNKKPQQLDKGSPWHISAILYTGHRLNDAGAAQIVLSEGPAQCRAS